MTGYCTTIKCKKFTAGRPVSLVGRIFGGRKIMTAMVVVVAVAAFGVYLTQINTISTKGFELKNLEKQIAELKDQNEQLQMNLVTKQSMSEIQGQVQKLNMVEASDIKYFDSYGTSLAKR